MTGHALAACLLCLVMYDMLCKPLPHDCGVMLCVAYWPPILLQHAVYSMSANGLPRI